MTTCAPPAARESRVDGGSPRPGCGGSPSRASGGRRPARVARQAPRRAERPDHRTVRHASSHSGPERAGGASGWRDRPACAHSARVALMASWRRAPVGCPSSATTPWVGSSSKSRQADAGEREHDRHGRVDPAQVRDELRGTVGVAAGPGVVHHDVRARRHLAGSPVEDRAGVRRGTAALLHDVAEPPERLDLLVGQVDVVVHDEHFGHGAPPGATGTSDGWKPTPSIANVARRTTRPGRVEGHIGRRRPGAGWRPSAASTGDAPRSGRCARAPPRASRTRSRSTCARDPRPRDRTRSPARPRPAPRAAAAP